MTDLIDTAGWWGGAGRSNRLTILDLIRNNTLDVRTAALLWLLVQNGASIIVASLPQRAGKTTLLSALMDFAPPEYEKVYTRGIHEDFSFLNTTSPSNTYILIPEISNHTPAYMWGDGLRTVFQAMDRGYSMAATMHADTPEDVIWMLDGHPMYIPHGQLSRIDLIVNIRLIRGDEDVKRRVNNVTMVNSGPSFTTVVEWDPSSDTFEQHVSDEALTPPHGDSIDAKVDALTSWLAREAASADELQDMIAAYYEASGS